MQTAVQLKSHLLVRPAPLVLSVSAPALPPVHRATFTCALVTRVQALLEACNLVHELVATTVVVPFPCPLAKLSTTLAVPFRPPQRRQQARGGKRSLVDVVLLR